MKYVIVSPKELVDQAGQGRTAAELISHIAHLDKPKENIQVILEGSNGDVKITCNLAQGISSQNTFNKVINFDNALSKPLEKALRSHAQEMLIN